MKRGAFEYLVKPVDVVTLGPVLARAFEAARLMQEPLLLPAEENPDRIIGRSAVIQKMCKAIGRIAPQDVNVLIRGESGTGKELVARALYHHSARAEHPFLAINCAAIPETLLESELFGHEQGTFTGATKRRIGKFEQCNQGTLFLDEIGDMPLALQAKMLRILQEQRFERLGGNQVIETQVRIVAATNQNLEKLVEEGRFRKDLYYRLNVVTIQVPPLREHVEDVPELAHYFLFRYARELSLDLRGFAPEAIELLQAYPWPGNVRELQSAIKQAMLHATGKVVLPAFLPEAVRGAGAAGPGVPPARAGESEGADFDFHALLDSLFRGKESNLHARVIETVERVLLARALRETSGHQTRASELLGLNRATLRHKLRALGLSIDKVVTEDETGDEG
jgi:two-component system nitrogen regulation response regulator GlnG